MEKDLRIVSLLEILEQDESVTDLSCLDYGEYAEAVDKITFDSEPEEADPICDLCVEWIRKNPEAIKNI